MSVNAEYNIYIEGRNRMSAVAEGSRLRGRVALVTGGSRGIGRAIALTLAQAGCNVAINYVEQTARAEEVLQELRSRKVQAAAVQADLSHAEDAQKLVRIVERELGSIDILINNAGIAITKPLPEVNLTDWERTISTNLTSAFLLSQAVVPGMRERRWGRLIFLSSVAAQTGGVIGPHYAASKAGMLGMMHSYANLLAKEGITSNAIAPALIETEMVRNNVNANPSLIPVGRFGTEDEVADIALLLCQNSYLNGQTISPNGGWYQT